MEAPPLTSINQPSSLERGAENTPMEEVVFKITHCAASPTENPSANKAGTKAPETIMIAKWICELFRVKKY